MDPVSSLSLACNILQLVELSSKIVIGAADLYREGANQENAELKDVTESLLRYTSAVKLDDSTSLERYDVELVDIADKARKVATELAVLLGSLEMPRDAEHRKWKAVRVAVRGMYKRDRVKSLEGRLQSLQGLLNTWMVRATKDESSMVSKQVAGLVEKHEALGAETSRSFQEMNQTLLEIQRFANEGNKEKVRKDAEFVNTYPSKQDVASGGPFDIIGFLRQYLPGGASSSYDGRNMETLQQIRTAAMRDEMRLWPEIYKKLSSMSEEAELVLKGQQILQSLYYSELLLRYDAVDEEYPETVRWIFDNGEHGFRDWLKADHGTYWISGKPGAGKTTLMKFICESGETEMLLKEWAASQELLIVKHFFWISGSELQRSEEGLLRSLMFQILRRWPEMIPLVCNERFHGDIFARTQPWKVNELSKRFFSLLHTVPADAKVCLFVDGLDEYEGDHAEIISLLERFTSSSKIKLCVSSRIWNVFQRAYGTKVKQLRVECLTRDDLRRYVQGRLLNNESLGSIIKSERVGNIELIEKLLNNAQGVFLWVKLVVGLLLKDAVNEPKIQDLHRLVDNYPKEIDPLYERMIETLDQSAFAQEAAQTLLFCLAERHCTIAKVWFLDLERENPNYALTRKVSTFTKAEMRQFRKTYSRLKGRCMDFLEVSSVEKSRTYVETLEGHESVTVTHRTANEFLNERRSWLRSRAGSSFFPDWSVCRADLGYLKALPAPQRSRVQQILIEKGHGSIQSVQEYRTYFLELSFVLFAARKCEEALHSFPLHELEEAERYFTSIFTPLLERSGALEILPTDIVSLDYLRFFFLALTIRLGPREFSLRKLKRNPGLAQKPIEKSLLLYFSLFTVSLMGFWCFLVDGYDVEVVQMILNLGADPNSLAPGKRKRSIWLWFLEEWTTDGEHVAVNGRKVIEALLDHGADPFMTVPVAGHDGMLDICSLEEVFALHIPTNDSVFRKLEDKRKGSRKSGSFWRGFKRK